MSQRGTVTKLVKEINESLGKDAPDKDLLQVKFNRLPAKHGELKELGEKNKAQLLDDKAEEHETMEDYEEKDEMIRVKLKKILHPVSERLPSPEPTTSTIRSESICRQHIMNVLKMEINKFNGDIENCLGFGHNLREFTKKSQLIRPISFRFWSSQWKRIRGPRKLSTVIRKLPKTTRLYSKL